MFIGPLSAGCKTAPSCKARSIWSAATRPTANEGPRSTKIPTGSIRSRAPGVSAALHLDWLHPAVSVTCACRVWRPGWGPFTSCAGRSRVISPDGGVPSAVGKLRKASRCFRGRCSSPMCYFRARGGELADVIEEDRYIPEGATSRAPGAHPGTETGREEDEDDHSSKPRWGYQCARVSSAFRCLKNVQSAATAR